MFHPVGGFDRAHWNPRYTRWLVTIEFYHFLLILFSFYVNIIFFSVFVITHLLETFLCSFSFWSVAITTIYPNALRTKLPATETLRNRTEGNDTYRIFSMRLDVCTVSQSGSESAYEMATNWRGMK